MSAVFSHFCFWIHASTHRIFVLSDGKSGFEFASQRETIAALRAAGAHEEERDGGEDRDVEKDDESEEDD